MVVNNISVPSESRQAEAFAVCIFYNFYLYKFNLTTINIIACSNSFSDSNCQVEAWVDLMRLKSCWPGLCHIIPIVFAADSCRPCPNALSFGEHHPPPPPHLPLLYLTLPSLHTLLFQLTNRQPASGVPVNLNQYTSLF